LFFENLLRYYSFLNTKYKYFKYIFDKSDFENQDGINSENDKIRKLLELGKRNSLSLKEEPLEEEKLFNDNWYENMKKCYKEQFSSKFFKKYCFCLQLASLGLKKNKNCLSKKIGILNKYLPFFVDDLEELSNFPQGKFLLLFKSFYLYNKKYQELEKNAGILRSSRSKRLKKILMIR